MRRLLFAGLFAMIAVAQAPPPGIAGTRHARLVVRNAMVVDGSGTPMSGPLDILIENDTITSIGHVPPSTSAQKDSVEIDAKGKYVLPGLINLHAHMQEERGGVPQPLEYEAKIWLACGITTIRDVGGSATSRALELRRQSNLGQIALPRVFVYPVFSTSFAGAGEKLDAGDANGTAAARQRVRELKQQQVDGIKIIGIKRDIFDAMADEAKKEGLRIAHHMGVEETNAWDAIRNGVTSIEHWYGIPDAALENGVQNFPSNYNYFDERDRFRYAGRLWREANPERLSKVLQAMADKGVAWNPTLSIYEASRDLQRAQTQPWFREYLHPTLEEFFKPNPANHGSYFFNWSSTDETFWKENYRIWMAAVREFERRGGVVGVGDDAGFIYSLYGFGLIREMELQQEAGFPTLKVIQHATANNAKILGQEARLGKLRVGSAADLIIVDGNPVENLKVLYPIGVDEIRDGKLVHTNGIEWTIKDGIPYYGPSLRADVKEIVSRARAAKGRPSSGTP